MGSIGFQPVRLRNRLGPIPATTIVMGSIREVLDSVVAKLSDENYAESVAFYRLWFDIGQTYLQVTSDQAFYAIWNKKKAGSINTRRGEVIYATAPLILRFAGDVDGGAPNILVPHGSGLRSRLCTTSLREFFSDNLTLAWCGENRNGGGPVVNFYANTNLIAHWVNLGYVEEATIRDHILQSLISHPKLHDHQADALVILFKLAGATFAACTDPSVVDRCFELLQNHEFHNPYGRSYRYPDEVHPADSYDLTKKGLLQVRTPRRVKGSHRAETKFQEVVALRERCWEDLPPPPAFATCVNQNEPAATPVVTSLGLPNGYLEPHIYQPPLPEPVTISKPEMIPASPVAPVTRSPSISIATLYDFTIADAFDDESHVEPTIIDTFDDEPPTNLMAVVTPHQTFYLEDGNVEVLCWNTLFRVHTTILSFHSPALCRMFAQTNLATAESPNGCPRILSSDAPKDFATLLKMIYLPGSVTPPACHCTVPLTTHLFTASLNGIGSQISSHSRPSSESPQSTKCSPSDLSYLRSFVMHIQRPLRAWVLPSRSEKASSADLLLTRTRSSTSSSNRISHLHYRWHTTWQLGGDWIR